MGILDQGKVDRIKRILKWHPRGMTISDISSEMDMNRNLVAKYLDMLLIAGQVEMQLIGAAKVYFLSRRVPISAILEFSSDMVIVVDTEERVMQVNEHVLHLFELEKEAITGRSISEIAHPCFAALYRTCAGNRPGGSSEQAIELGCTVKGEERHFRSKKIPTAFEDGSDGYTYIIEDVTAQKRYEERLRLSETRYRGLVQSSGEAIFGTATDGTVTSLNPAAERLLGYSEAEVLARPVLSLVPPHDQGRAETVLAQVRQGETVRRHELKLQKKDHTIIDVLITTSPVTDENGAVTGASSIARDITGEKMERYLREHEDQYRTLVEDLNVGIYRSTGDPAGRFVWGNTALLNILGYDTFRDLEGIDVVNVFSTPEGRLQLLRELQDNRFVKNRVLHLKRPDGAPISVSVTALAEFNEKNELVFINGVVQDITGFSNHFPRPDGL